MLKVVDDRCGVVQLFKLGVVLNKQMTLDQSDKGVSGALELNLIIALLEFNSLYVLEWIAISNYLNEILVYLLKLCYKVW